MTHRRAPAIIERMREALVQGLLTGWAIVVPVGAVGALLVTLTARTSFRTGRRPPWAWRPWAGGTPRCSPLPSLPGSPRGRSWDDAACPGLGG